MKDEVAPLASKGENDSPAASSLACRILRRLISLAQALSVVLICVTVATGFARYHWCADLLANLRVQQVLVLVGVLMLFLVSRQWKWCVVVGVMIAIHVPWFAAAFPVRSHVQRNASDLRITLANVFTRNDQHGKIADDIVRGNPQVIVILELSSSLAQKLSDELAESHPHRILYPDDAGNFGIGLFSAFAIKEYKLFDIDESIGIKSIEAAIGGYRVYATHPLPPMSSRGFAARNRHLDKFASRIRDHQGRFPEQPIVLVGDLNVTPWSPFFADFEQRSGLKRAIDGIDFEPTWYAFDWFPFGLVLDHAMISHGVRCIDQCVGPNIGSDHRSVTVELSLAQ